MLISSSIFGAFFALAGAEAESSDWKDWLDESIPYSSRAQPEESRIIFSATTSVL